MPGDRRRGKWGRLPACQPLAGFQPARGWQAGSLPHFPRRLSPGIWWRSLDGLARQFAVGLRKAQPLHEFLQVVALVVGAIVQVSPPSAWTDLSWPGAGA